MQKEITEVMAENENLVYSIINKYRLYADIEDLYQVGMIGLINAYKNYNYNINTKFSTYAYMYILGEVNKYANENRTIRISKDYHRLIKKLKEAKGILNQTLMREPSTLDLANFLEMDISLIEQLEQLNYRVDSLDKSINKDDSDNNLYDTIPNKEYLEFDDKILLSEQLNMLSDYEKQLIINRYYLDKTQQEMAAMLGINQVQVSREEKKVLQKIKKNIL